MLLAARQLMGVRLEQAGDTSETDLLLRGSLLDTFLVELNRGGDELRVSRWDPTITLRLERP